MLARAELSDEAWLRSIVAFGEVNAPPVTPPTRDGSVPRVVAIVLLVKRSAA
jgi:hypothetical protein